MPNEFSKTKIIATIGPACSPPEVLREMFLSGVDVCRLNFSHGSHEDHLKSIELIRKINAELGTHVAILADLQGPKLRVGVVKEGTVLREGSELAFRTQAPFEGDAEQVYMTYKQFPRDVEVGDFVLIDDGKLKLQVTFTNRIDTVKARVLHGGKLSSKKGVNLPSTKISLPSLTEKDERDLYFALDHDVDWVALSFVRNVTDIVELKAKIRKHKKNAFVVAKIEKPEAMEEIDNIIDMTDGIMVARGDLGVEMDFEQLPMMQKEIARKCNAASKPVIVATQMMESMIDNFRPTRAEANDVANAVLDGADTVMLSGETSVGKYPVEVIRSMQKIIRHTEAAGHVYLHDFAPKEFNPKFLANSVCYNAVRMAKQSGAKAIITFTDSGYTAFKIASHRPEAQIYAFTPREKLVAKMSLLWGVRAFHVEEHTDIDALIEHSIEVLKKRGLIRPGDIVIHVGSLPLKSKDRTNMMKISII